ncbi:protoporphyrinogen IX oxidase [bacterium]|nr:protoporphyrinogen IX oxidase [bacterium]
MLLFYVKAAHVVAVVSWFSGLFFLVRMMIYHVEALQASPPKTEIVELMELAERRISGIILNPMMVATILLGTVLVYLTGALYEPWLHVKLFFVLVLMAYHFYCLKMKSQLKIGRVPMRSASLRLFNEVPFFLLVGIVVTVYVHSAVAGIAAVGILAAVVVGVGVVFKWVQNGGKR